MLDSGLDEFDEGAGEVLRMDKGDPGPSTSGAGGVIDEVRPLPGEIGEGGVDVRDGKSDMMHTFTVAGEKSAHGAVGGERGDQLQERPTDGQHRLLHALTGHHFPVERRHAVAGAESLDGFVQIVDGNGDMIEVVGQHGGKYATAGGCGARRAAAWAADAAARLAAGG